MMTVLLAKFHQNKRVRDALSNTGDKDIVECNRYDTFWSSGVALKDYLTLDEDFGKWKGKNILGKKLQTIRDDN